MIKIICDLLALLFFLKLAWNALTPFAVALAYRAWKKGGGKKPGNISMAPLIEIGLLLCLVVLSFITQDGYFNNDPLRTVLVGSCGIVISYGLTVIFGIIVQKILRT